MPIKAGILGGGQLGRMLLQEAANFPVETHVLENDPECPSAHLCHHFHLGDIRDYDTVKAFGEQVDVLTIEIEDVNVEALEALEAAGKLVIPAPAVLKMIQNKITQKEFYRQHDIASPDFAVTESQSDLHRHLHLLPAVHKIGKGGYDGKGVQILHSADDLHKGFDAPGVLERKVDIAMEVAIMVAVDRQLKQTLYPPVEMVFNNDLNLLDYQISPAALPENTLWKVEAIARKLVTALCSPGLFAVEMLIDARGEVWVNETAPRVHNSGHHTIEANYTSQYEMLWRILLNYPLGDPSAICPSALVNLLGAPDSSGPSSYEDLESVLSMQGVYVHLYGKKTSKPGRKMGHVTILGTDKTDVMFKAKKVKNTLKVSGSAGT